MSYKVDVVADRSGEWTSNQVRLATEQEAKSYGFDLAMRWLAVREWRVTESNDVVNYTFTDGKLNSVSQEQAS